MSNLSLFFKKNKPKKENVFYPATKELKDEKGNPLLWEIRPLTIKENENIQASCMADIPIKGKQFRQKFDTNKYVNAMLVKSIVFPDLHNVELQDSYGVKKPEDLIKEMIDNIGEYNDFAAFVQELNDVNPTIEEEIDLAKN